MSSNIICVVCRLDAELKCQRCSEYYCSVECQIADWRNHKYVCLSMPMLIPVSSSPPSASRLNRGMVLRNQCSHSSQPLRRPHSQFQSYISKLSTSENIDSTNKTIDESMTPPDTKSQKEIDVTLEPQNSIAVVEKLTEMSIEPNKFNLPSQLNPPPCSDKPWQTPYPFKRNELIEVIVQYVDKKYSGLVWVMQSSLQHNCDKLFSKINKAISRYNTRQCTESEIRVGEIFSAPFEGLYYRAVILEEINPFDEVQLRLVDYGNELFVPINELRPAIPIMNDQNAYAFCVRRRNHKLEIGDSVKIRIIGKDLDVYLIETNENDEVVATDLKSLPRTNVFEGLNDLNNIKFSKNLTSKKTLAYFVKDNITENFIEMDNFLTKIDEAQDGNIRLAPPNVGDFVAGKTDSGWKRGVVLASYNNEYVMSLCDTGVITFITKFNIIPNEYRIIPTQTFVLEINNISPETGFKMEFFANSKTLRLKVGEYDDDDNNKLTAILYDAEKDTALAEVYVYPWHGTISELDKNYWPFTLSNNENVKITNIIKYSKVCICPADKFNFYSKTFHDIGFNAPSLNPSDAKRGTIVLAPNCKTFVRCLIIDKPDNTNCELLDLDSGREFICSDDELKFANNFVKHCPVYVIPVNLRLTDKIQPSVHQELAVKALKSLMDDETIFSVKFEVSYKNGVELCLKNDNAGSQDPLIKMLFANLFGRNSKEEQFEDISEDQEKPMGN